MSCSKPACFLGEGPDPVLCRDASRASGIQNFLLDIIRKCDRNATLSFLVVRAAPCCPVASLELAEDMGFRGETNAVLGLFLLFFVPGE